MRARFAWRFGAAVVAAAAGTFAGIAVPSCGSDDGAAVQPPPPTSDRDAAEITCTSGLTACGGACVDTRTDLQNCGTCGSVCTGGACCASRCVQETPTCAFALTGVEPPQGHQSGGEYVTLKGAGFVPGMRVFIGDGAAPARVVDAQTLLVQTPPGTMGFKDLRIVSGNSRASLPGAFLYTSSGVEPKWTEKPMKTVRGEDPALAVLQDGRVLVAGGTTVPDHAENAVNTAEIYTRSNDSVAPAKGPMSTVRWHPVAVTLMSGKALVVGGTSPSALADLFDPATDTFKATAKPMNTARNYLRGVLMVDGKVMISSQGVSTAEIYDPEKDEFTQIPTKAVHTFGFVVRLRDGRVMLGGGDRGQTAVEVYDPTEATPAFKLVAPLNQGRSMLTAHTLPDGRVIVLGGASESAGGITVPLDSIELYDPVANKWTLATFKMSSGRTWHAGALLRDGTVLAMGGYHANTSCAPTNTVDQIDPVTGKVTVFDALPHPNTEWTAVTLLDGSVLGVGGGACGTPTALPSLDFLPGAVTGK